MIVSIIQTSGISTAIFSSSFIASRARRHTTILTDNLQIISPYNTTPPDAIRNVIREIRTIINEINKLKPYCDEKSKKSIELFSESGARARRVLSNTGLIIMMSTWKGSWSQLTGLENLGYRVLHMK